MHRSTYKCKILQRFFFARGTCNSLSKNGHFRGPCLGNVSRLRMVTLDYILTYLFYLTLKLIYGALILFDLFQILPLPEAKKNHVNGKFCSTLTQEKTVKYMKSMLSAQNNLYYYNVYDPEINIFQNLWVLKPLNKSVLNHCSTPWFKTDIIQGHNRYGCSLPNSRFNVNWTLEHLHSMLTSASS